MFNYKELLKEAREQENAFKQTLPEGTYLCSIKSATLTVNSKGYEVVEFKLKVKEPQKYSQKQITKTYMVDPKYSNAGNNRKLLIDLSALAKLLSGWNLSFESQEDLYKLLFTLRDKEVKATLKYSKPTSNGVIYNNYTLEAVNGNLEVKQSTQPQQAFIKQDFSALVDKNDEETTEYKWTTNEAEEEKEPWEL